MQPFETNHSKTVSNTDNELFQVTKSTGRQTVHLNTCEESKCIRPTSAEHVNPCRLETFQNVNAKQLPNPTDDLFAALPELNFALLTYKDSNMKVIDGQNDKEEVPCCEYWVNEMPGQSFTINEKTIVNDTSTNNQETELSKPYSKTSGPGPLTDDSDPMRRNLWFECRTEDNFNSIA